MPDVQIVAGLFLLIVLFHIGKFIFKKAKKWLSLSQPEVCETTPKRSEEKVLRKFSTSCAQKQRINSIAVVKYEDELPQLHRSRTCRFSKSSQNHKNKPKSFRRARSLQNRECEKKLFFAGYSHLNRNEENCLWKTKLFSNFCFWIPGDCSIDTANFWVNRQSQNLPPYEDITVLKTTVGCEFEPLKLVCLTASRGDQICSLQQSAEYLLSDNLGKLVQE